MKGGAAKKFDEKFLGRKTYKSWCSAHKLEKCGEKAEKVAPGHKEYDSLINLIYTFYGPQNHKVSRA